MPGTLSGRRPASSVSPQSSADGECSCAVIEAVPSSSATSSSQAPLSTVAESLQLGPDGDNSCACSEMEVDHPLLDTLTKEHLNLVESRMRLLGARRVVSEHGQILFAKIPHSTSLELALLIEAKKLRIRNEDVSLPLLIQHHVLDLSGRRLLLTVECGLGDLRSLLEAMAPVGGVQLKVVVRLLHGIAIGLDFLHVKRIAHLAIRLEHVLVDVHARSRLGGLSRARVFPNSAFCFVTDLNLDLHYTPPECLEQGEVNPFKVDLFAVGVIFHRLALGDWPSTSSSSALVDLPLELRRSVQSLLGQPRHRPSPATLRHSSWMMEAEQEPVHKLLSVFKLVNKKAAG